MRSFVGSLLVTIPLVTALPTIGQRVQTSRSIIQGHPSSWRPEVSEYLGIPFAKAPIGPLRWAAPQAYQGSPNETITATKFSPDCPANVRPVSPKDNGTAAAGLLSLLGQAGDVFSEDCLTVNVWTKPQSGEKKKAVMVWIYGGGFNTGNSASPSYNGARLADEHDVVVVNMNYRLNIFGFPNAPFLPDQNLGLLDQRLAVEWVRDNIEAFGGDAKRIILFGESAGAASVDYYSYAWTQDPIVTGFIPESGTASNRATGNPSKPWYDASQKLGCGGAVDGEKTLQCMRSKTMEQVLDAIKPPGGVPALSGSGFSPSPDGKTVFSDYAARRAAGKFVKKPMLVGNNDNEAGLTTILSGAGASGGTSSNNLTTAESNARSTCGSHEAAQARRNAGLNSWRYRYAGEWNNQYIGEGAGAYHGSEIALVFGTTSLLSKKPDVEEEIKLSNAMRTAWTSFAKDPENGLAKLGWPVYDQSKPTLVKLGGRFNGDIKFVDNAVYDKDCARLRVGVARKF